MSMTREIKFRGKAAGTWYFGNLQTRKISRQQSAAWIIGYDESPMLVSVDPSTVGQFTGLHDKNGKEIYEGDILRKSTFVDIDYDFTETYLDRDTIGVVRILPSCGTTICDCIVYETDDPYKEKMMKERIKRAHVVGKRCEIIGNIYDDPELLNKGE